MKRILLFLVVLATALTASAWLGMEDSAEESGRRSRDSLNTVTARRQSASQGAAVAVDPRYRQAYAQQRIYQTTRSLVPIARASAADRETGAADQDYSEYIRASRRIRGTLVLQPLGDMPPDQKKAIGHVLDAVSAFFGVPAVCASPVDSERLPRQYSRTVDGERMFSAEALMTSVLRPNVGAGVASVLGVTTEEIYPGERWGFSPTTAVSSYRDGVGVLSTAHLFDRTRADRGRNLHRLTKGIIHELCHTLAMKDCHTYSCLMNGSADQSQADARPLALCPDCLAKLSLATGRDPALHLEDMLGLCKAKGFGSEARYYLKAMRMLK